MTRVTSDSMIYDSDAGKVTFSKSVNVTHPDFTLNSNKLDLFLAKAESGSKSGGVSGMDAGKVERVVALENVRIKLPQGRSATCSKATYMVRTETLKMEGNPILREDGNQLGADIIYFYFKENRSQAEGNVKVDFISKDNASGSVGQASDGGAVQAQGSASGAAGVPNVANASGAASGAPAVQVVPVSNANAASSSQRAGN
ncbi:hypothetical protein LJC48_01400 [Desulfovibrio sp. OttesenSCG-928-C06]|nr:hypothetical protein [Desulfovibrio sp. OttesenSCG-928-C06]